MMVEVEGGRLKVCVDGAGAPVLLVHGIFASGYCWREVVPILAREYRVYTVDLLGFGESDMPPLADYSQSAHARRLHELIQKLNLHNLRLVGHSMGGEISVHALLQNPEPFAQCALVSADGFRPAFRGWQRRLLSGFWMNGFVRTFFSERGFARAVTRIVQEPQVFSSEIVQGYLKPYQRAEFPHAVRQLVRNREGGLDPARVASLPDLPTLLLWGDQDRIVPVAIGEQYRKLLPHADWQLLPNCGHMPMEEFPAETAERLLTFFKRV
nr:alpha/beta hydrolase [Tumebacillus amylolyticus]